MLLLGGQPSRLLDAGRPLTERATRWVVEGPEQGADLAQTWMAQWNASLADGAEQGQRLLDRGAATWQQWVDSFRGDREPSETEDNNPKAP